MSPDLLPALWFVLEAHVVLLLMAALAWAVRRRRALAPVPYVPLAGAEVVRARIPYRQPETAAELEELVASLRTVRLTRHTDAVQVLATRVGARLLIEATSRWGTGEHLVKIGIGAPALRTETSVRELVASLVHCTRSLEAQARGQWLPPAQLDATSERARAELKRLGCHLGGLPAAGWLVATHPEIGHVTISRRDGALPSEIVVGVLQGFRQCADAAGYRIATQET